MRAHTRSSGNELLLVGVWPYGLTFAQLRDVSHEWFARVFTKWKSADTVSPSHRTTVDDASVEIFLGVAGLGPETFEVEEHYEKVRAMFGQNALKYVGTRSKFPVTSNVANFIACSWTPEVVVLDTPGHP